MAHKIGAGDDDKDADEKEEGGSSLLSIRSIFEHLFGGGLLTGIFGPLSVKDLPEGTEVDLERGLFDLDTSFDEVATVDDQTTFAHLTYKRRSRGKIKAKADLGAKIRRLFKIEPKEGEEEKK